MRTKALVATALQEADIILESIEAGNRLALAVETLKAELRRFSAENEPTA